MNIYSPEFRKKILIFLFSLAVLLLALNLLSKNKISLSSNDEKDVNVVEISNRFINILSSFGIEEKLVKKTFSNEKVSGLSIPKFRIQVPKDLSIPEILQDVYNEFRKDSLKFESVEKVKGGKSLLIIKYGRDIVLFSEFEYSKNILRDKKYFALLITDLDFENTADSVLIESSESINFLIRPNSKYKDLITFIKSNKKEFSLLIDDDTEEQKYKLAPGYSEQRVINVMNTLVKDFSKASFFVIDDNSGFYNSSNFKIFSKALSVRQINLSMLSEFKTFDENQSLTDELNIRLDNISNNKSSIFLVSKDSYEQIKPNLIEYFKKGYRIVNSSLLISDDQ